MVGKKSKPVAFLQLWVEFVSKFTLTRLVLFWESEEFGCNEPNGNL